MGVKPLFANILWISLIYGIYSTSFSDSYVQILKYELFNEYIHNGNWVLFFKDTSFQKHDEMNINIDYLAAKYTSQIHIGYIDCSTEKKLCEQFAISKYPTIKYVVNGVFHDYYGRNSLRSLIEACDSLIKPVSVLMNDTSFNSFTQQNDVVFLCVYDNSSSSQALLSTFNNVTQQLLLYSTFSITNQPLSRLPPIQPPYVVRIEGDEDYEYYTEESKHESLLDWIRQRTLPLLPEYRGNPFSAIVRSDKFTLLILFDSSTSNDVTERNRMKMIIRSLPISLKKRFAFAYLDGMEWGEYIQQYGVSSKQLPCAVVLHERTGRYYKPVKLTSEAITQYLLSISSNKLSPTIYSILRYQFSRFMKVFMSFPFITRFFLSISFTFSLAVITLNIIFFFTRPQKEVKSKKEMKKRHKD